MNKKQLHLQSLQKVKELSPDVYNKVMNVSLPFYELSGILYAKTEEIISSKYALSQTQVDVLASLYYASDDSFSLSPTQLYDILFFSSGGMTKVLKKLEEKKYIKRVNNKDDKRSKLVQITPLGKDITQKALKDISNFEKKYFEKLNIKEQEDLTKLLYKVLA